MMDRIFVSFRFFFSDNTSQSIYFFCRAKRKFFFQNLTLGYMTKTLNQIIFIFLHQNQNIFFSNIGNQNIFLEKNHNPPFKLNGCSLNTMQVVKFETFHEMLYYLQSYAQNLALIVVANFTCIHFARPTCHFISI